RRKCDAAAVDVGLGMAQFGARSLTITVHSGTRSPSNHDRLKHIDSNATRSPSEVWSFPWGVHSEARTRRHRTTQICSSEFLCPELAIAAGRNCAILSAAKRNPRKDARPP